MLDLNFVRETVVVLYVGRVVVLQYVCTGKKGSVCVCGGGGGGGVRSDILGKGNIQVC